MEGDRRSFVFLINSLIPGGAERSLVELLPRLVDRGIHPIILCLNDREIGFQQEVIDGGYDIRFVAARSFAGRVREVRRQLRTERPALLHTTLFDADVVGRVAAIATGVPVVSTLANTTYDAVRIAGDENLSHTKVAAVRLIDGLTARYLTRHLHAVSSAVKDSAVAHLDVAPGKVSVVHRGRDPVRLGRATPERRAMARDMLGLGEAEVILTVGRHEFQKGHLNLIDAFGMLARRRTAAVLVVAGREGNTSEALHTRVDAMGISERVRFLGHRADVPDLMVAADVFAFPSLWEGLGGVLIEALALEVPIVTSDLAATREVVGEDGLSGLLVPPGDAAALADAIENILSDPSLADRTTSKSRDRFESRFLLEDRSKELIDLLVEVAG